MVSSSVGVSEEQRRPGERELFAERALIAKAAAGDRAAFAELVEPYRRGLHVHCYRMLGSLHDAEDLLQETLLRAWRALGRLEERSSFRGWLYRIATNACLDALKRRRRRLLPDSYAAPADPAGAAAPAVEEPLWLEPYPDALLDGDPLARLEGREGIELAFLVAVQRLSPGQRAALILRDVLGFSARETADILGTSVASVNSVLHRARAAAGAGNGRRAPAGDEAALVARYVEAWEAADVDGLVALLREDARMTMPPTPSWYLGRDAIGAFLADFFGREQTDLAPTRANRQPALAVYTRSGPLAVKVLTLDGGAIAAITGFTDPSLFPYFRLSPRP
jgi:RNA polymerase sigma-70 factor (ECF subfamily)